MYTGKLEYAFESLLNSVATEAEDLLQKGVSDRQLDWPGAIYFCGAVHFWRLAILSRFWLDGRFIQKRPEA